MNKGLFIVLYGPDGGGKSRQVLMLEEKLREQGLLARNLRYPVYTCAPTGPKLDEILHRKKKSLPEEEMQKMFAANRKDFEPTLKSWLENGVNVIAENYKGTGIAWGVSRGMTVEKMESMNKDMIDPDVAIYMDGPKRGESLVEGHPYATGENVDEWYKVRKVYLQMADRYGWVRVGGDAPVLVVANRIWAVVRPVVMSRV